MPAPVLAAVGAALIRTRLGAASSFNLPPLAGRSSRCRSLLMSLQQSVLALIWVAGTAFTPAQERAPTAIRFETDLVLGLDEQRPDTMFGQVRTVRSGSDSRIFIADPVSASIKVFGPRGESLGHIGGRGFAPRRLRGVSAIHLTGTDSLVVLDNVSGQIATFDPRGRFVASASIDERFAVVGPNLAQTPSGDWLVLKSIPGIDSLLHLFDGESGNPLHSFGPRAIEQSGDSVAMKEFLEIHPGHFWLIEGGKALLFAPGLFSGEVLTYRLIGGMYRLAGRIKSRFAPPDYCGKTVKSGTTDSPHFRTIIDGIEYSAKIGCESRGVFSLDEKRIIVFTLVRGSGDARELMVEVFGAGGEALAFGPLTSDDFAYAGPRLSTLTVMWKDSSNRFYLVERTTRPLVRVGRLDLRFLDNDANY